MRSDRWDRSTQEVEISAGNGTQYRIFGFFGPDDDDFTMLLPLRKNDDPKYRRSCKEAQRRKAEVIHDWTRARRWEAPQSN
jgi:hypothetical protein